jgi:neurofibromin 1
MKPEIKVAVAVPLRTAIWNWVSMFPDEYNEAIRTQRRLEGTPERVFDLLWDPSEVASARALWPTLAALAVISSERMRSDLKGSSKSNLKKARSWPCYLRRLTNWPVAVFRPARQSRPNTQ